GGARRLLHPRLQGSGYGDPVRGYDPVGEIRVHRGPAGHGDGAALSEDIEPALRAAWWPAAAVVARLSGDLSLAQDCAQEACAAALEQWPRDGIPANPSGWVVTVARHRVLDHLRRGSTRAGKERQALQEWTAAEPDRGAIADDQLALLFACCHPALESAARVTLTLWVVCGLPVGFIGGLLLLRGPAVGQPAVCV